MSKIRHWLPPILYMALIFWLSSMPAPEELSMFPVIAKLKLVHMIEYGIMYYLVWRAIRLTSSYSAIETFVLALSTITLFGLTDEFHQIFVQGRTARFEDVIADLVGGMLVQTGIIRKY